MNMKDLKPIPILMLATISYSANIVKAIPDETETAMRTLEGSRQGISRDELQAASHKLMTIGRVGDHVTWQRLRRVIQDTDIHRDVRLEAMRIACKKCDGVIASEILALYKEWHLQIAPEAEHWAKMSESNQSLWALIGVVHQHLESHFQWVLTDQRPLLEIWAGTKNARCIADSPAPIVQRREAALSLIRKFPNESVPYDHLIPLLDESTLPVLRALVRASDDPLAFHFHATATLAYLGDQEILPDLRSRVDSFSQSPNAASYVKQSIWLIEIQHPPSKLLNYISSLDDLNLHFHARRRTIIRLAIERGITKSQIRQAMLEFAGQYSQLGRSPRYRMLQDMKETGLKLGILQLDDLPQVSEPPVNRNITICFDTKVDPNDYDRLAPGPRPTSQAVAAPPPMTSAPARQNRPARQPWWPKKWKPNEANRPAFNAWFESQRQTLVDLPGDESLLRIKSKMCELDLLAPDDCARLGLPTPASQPTSGPAP